MGRYHQRRPEQTAFLYGNYLLLCFLFCFLAFFIFFWCYKDDDHVDRETLRTLGCLVEIDSQLTFN